MTTQTEVAPAGTPFEWPEGATPRQLLVEFLRERASADEDAPAQGRPWITEGGKVYVHPSWWTEWLAQRVGTGAVPKRAALQALRDLGLVQRATPVPVLGHALGLYQGTAPRGTGEVPRRVVRRGRRPQTDSSSTETE